MPKILILQGQQARQAIAQINLARGKQAATFNDAVDGWLKWRREGGSPTSVSQYWTYLQTWLKEVGERPISKPDEAQIKAWVNVEGTKRSTRATKLAVIRSFFKYLSAKDLLTTPNPTILLRVDHRSMTHEEKESRPVEIFYDHEFRKLVTTIESRIMEVTEESQRRTGTALLRKLGLEINRLEFWKKATIMSRCVGLRFGDICQLEWASFGEVFTVWTDKRNRRVQPTIWNRELWNATFNHLVRMGRFCFPTERAVYLNEATRTVLCKQFKSLCKQSGLPDHTFHGLRHTYATGCARAGIDTPHIQRSLGHASISQTQNYLH